MKTKMFFIAIVVIFMAGCSEKKATESEHELEHEEIKFQYATYTSDLELFVEADPLVKGEECNVLSHFTTLNNFKPLKNARVTLKLLVNGKELTETLENTDHTGIYSFNIKPETPGQGQLSYEISSPDGNFQVVVPNVTVFETEETGHEAAAATVVSKTNTSVFTKEQSWKIDFRTELPVSEPFGQVIKTVAQVKNTPSEEIILTAKSNGIVRFLTENCVEGKTVSTGAPLFSVSGNQLAANNSSVLFTEAQNNYQMAKADYERKQELAKDKIISEKDLLEARNKFENTRVIYETLEKNFNETGELVKSPISGYFSQIFVENGKYIEQGQPLARIAQNKKLLLHAEVQPKYESLLNNFSDAVIQTMANNHVYDLKELNGEMVSYGKSTGEDNFLIPVHLKIDNSEGFIPGEFVDLYLKTSSTENKLIIPSSALLEEQGYYFVYVQKTPELFEKREVTPGNTDGLRTEIIEGISPDERVVTRGAMFIKLSQATGALDPHAGHVH